MSAEAAYAGIVPGPAFPHPSGEGVPGWDGVDGVPGLGFELGRGALGVAVGWGPDVG
jgi:hypothetical protein